MIDAMDQFLEPESESINIEKLLRRVYEGEWKLFLPSFQRSFVWDDEDVKRLFESIKRLSDRLNTPMGTI